MTTADQPSVEPPTHVVGVGASTSGLALLEEFLAALPARAALAYVVVGPAAGFDDALQERLAQRTKLRLRSAEQGVVVQPGHIYLTPAEMLIRIEGGNLLLAPGRSQTVETQPINTFFRSLARELGANAIGVLLAGGGDGVLGACDIHQAGGLVLAQSDLAATLAETSTNQPAHVHLVHSPAELAELIAHHVSQHTHLSSVTALRSVRREEHRTAAMGTLLRSGAPSGGSSTPVPIGRAPDVSQILSPAQPAVDQELLATYDRLLDRYMPSSMLLNSRFEIVHVFGGAERYLRHRSGRPAKHILDLIDPSLQAAMSSGLTQVVQSGELAHFHGLLDEDGQRQVRVSLTLEPTLDSSGAVDQILVLFEAVNTAGDEPQPAPHRTVGEPQGVENTPEIESRFKQPTLQTSAGRIEPAHQGLQASPAELVKLNDVLQRSNERLHNINEQLYSLNLENQRRVQELTRANEGVEQLLAAAGTGVVLLDDDLRLRRFTPAAASILHLLAHDVGRPFADLLHSLQCPDLAADLQVVVTQGREREQEVRDAQGKPYRLRMMPCGKHVQAPGSKASARSPAAVAITLHEVETVTRLDSKGKLLEQAVDAAALAITVADASADGWPIVYASEGFEQLTGYASESVLGKNCRFLQGPDTDQDAVAQLRSALAQGRPCRVTLLNYRKNGQPFWNDLQLSPLLDQTGKVTHVVGVQHDVTQQVRRERTASENEWEYRSTFENAAVGLAHWDAEGRWVRVNQRLCEILGYNRDELLGMTFHQLTDPEDLQGDIRTFQSLISGEHDSDCHESRYHHRDGHVVWVLLTLSRQVRSDGRIAGCIVAIQDITQRKRTEIALEKARRMADSANRAKSSFVTNISHELRSPMTAVLGFAEMLADEIDVPEQLQKVQILRRNGQFLLRLLDDILDLSKIESRRFQSDTEPCDLMALIDEVEVLMQGRASQIGSRLWFHFPTLLPKTIYTSSMRVRQILVNLIANAFKFPLRGDVNVTIRYRAEHGEDEQAEPCVEFEVADTGVELSRPPQASAFTPFTPADPEIAQQFAGRGSGLSITKRLVSTLGGVLEFTTGEKGGSIFLARLPVGEAVDMELISREARVPEVPALTEPSQLKSITGKILVADDRRDIWQVTKYFLERSGAEVEVAEDGRQAVDAVQAAAREGEPFDLLLLDMQMPVMNGLEAVRELRGAGFSLPIIALTADAMKGERQRCLAAGCDDYLTKPIDVVLLTETVAKHLGEKA